MGEHEAAALLGPGWERSLCGLERRGAAILMRAVRDHLADCLVTLPELVERRADASLHLWFANLDGMRRELFPRAQDAYRAWLGGDRGQALLATAKVGAEHWRRACGEVLDAIAGPDGELAVEALALDEALRL